MAETPFTIGADVRCADGVCGKVTHVVVDPVKRAVTHLVVEPRHRPGLGRLVPLDLVDAATPKEVRLRCTRAEFDHLGFAEDTDFAPRTGLDQYSGYSAEQMLMWPYYSPIGGEGMPQTREDEPTGAAGSCPRVRSRCGAISASMPPTARSGESRGLSSTLAAIA